MKQTFSGASRGPAPDIKTKAELLHRLRNRQKPAPQRHLTPGGMSDFMQAKNTYNEAERRIKELRSRLTNAKAGFNKDMALAKRKGLAKADFGRSR